ncbi:MAG: biotin/lipoyl-binding protein, partial [Bacteroidota bacterium]
MKQKQILRFAIILIVLLLLFIVIGRRAGWIDSTTGIRVTLEEAERRSITEIVTASGKVQPVTEVKISPDVSGEIVEILAKEGDFVNKGDLLVRINPEIYVSALDLVEASLNSSRANLSNARARKAQA